MDVVELDIFREVVLFAGQGRKFQNGSIPSIMLLQITQHYPYL